MKNVITVNANGKVDVIMSYPDDFNDKALVAMIEELSNSTVLYSSLSEYEIDKVARLAAGAVSIDMVLSPIETELLNRLAVVVLPAARLRKAIDVRVEQHDEATTPVALSRVNITAARIPSNYLKCDLTPNAFQVNCAITGIGFIQELLSTVSIFAPRKVDDLIFIRNIKDSEGMKQHMAVACKEVDTETKGYNSLIDGTLSYTEYNDLCPESLGIIPKSVLKILENSLLFIPSLYHYSVSVAAVNTEETLV